MIGGDSGRSRSNSPWRGSSRGGGTSGTNSSSRGESSTATGSGRGRARTTRGASWGTTYVAGKAGAAVDGAGKSSRSSNLSWRATPAHLEDATALPNHDDLNTSAGVDPASLGTPAFAGGGGSSSSMFTSMSQDYALGSEGDRTGTSTPISSLEIMGEDSDGRRKRFESTLTNNRYIELKPLREAQRVSDIENGFIPDPTKPMRLDEATDFLGTCEEMCPEWEREEREYQKSVDVWERYPGTNRIDPSRAVKAFHRPAAGNDQPLPSDVRPPHVLKLTLDYLFHTLLPSQSFALTHPFLRDRTRAVRQDFTMQNDRGSMAIECNERIARYHVLALGVLRESSGFSESQELEQLRKVLKSLNEFYDDARTSIPPVPTPNEPEFRSYNILTHLRDPDIIWSTELLPLTIFNSPLLQTALSLHSLAQRSNELRGERASPNAWSRFFKLLASTRVPYLFSCLLSTHFTEIRIAALKAMRKAYFAQHSLFPMRTLVKVLGCDDDEEMEKICEMVGLNVVVNQSGKKAVELSKNVVILDGVIPQRVSRRLVESKRGNAPYSSVIDGIGFAVQAVSPIPTSPISLPRRRISSLTQFPTTSYPSPSQVAASPVNKTSIFSAPPTFPPPPPPPPQIFPSIPPKLSAFAPSFTPSFDTTASTPLPVAATLPTVRPVVPTVRPFVPPPPASTFSSLAPVARSPAQNDVKQKIPTPLTLASPSLAAVDLPIPSPSHLSSNERRRLVSTLSSTLTSDIINSYTTRRARRIGETTLGERWDRILEVETRSRQRITTRLSEALTVDVLSEIIQRESRRIVWSERRERAIKEEFFWRWNVRSEELREEREEEHERERVFEEVLEDIGVGEEIDEMGFEGLSIREDRGGRDSSLDVDETVAEKVLLAQSHREKLWSAGSFLNILSRHFEILFRSSPSTSRPRHSTIISSRDDGMLSLWLSRKFDLEEDSKRVAIDMMLVDLEVMMHSRDEKTDTSTLESTGFVLFEYSISEPDARKRLQSLLKRINLHSIYAPSLLIVVALDDVMTADTVEMLKSKISTQLELLSTGLQHSILLLDLEDSDEQFERELNGLTREIVYRPEKRKLAASVFMLPLLSKWRDSLQGSLHSIDSNGASLIMLEYIASLDAIVGYTRECLVEIDREKYRLPSFSQTPSSLRTSISSYIMSSFDDVGNFPFIQAALAELPLVSDLALVRILLDHLADYSLALFSNSSIRQASLDSTLSGSLAMLDTILESNRLAIDKSRTKNERKKRKASTSPPDFPIYGKKVTKDGLNSLKELMKETRALIQ